MKLARLAFSFRGRIARSSFWAGAIILVAAFVVLYVFMRSEISERSTLALYPPFLWIFAALAVKRMRDRGRAPWWLTAALVPVLGPLWLVIELGLRRGTQGENQYGPDPLEVDADYLTVDIARP